MGKKSESMDGTENLTALLSEGEFVWNMLLDPANRNEDGSANWNEIVYEVNKVHHNSHAIRNGFIMPAIVNQYTSSLPESELLKGLELQRGMLY